MMIKLLKLHGPLQQPLLEKIFLIIVPYKYCISTVRIIAQFHKISVVISCFIEFECSGYTLLLKVFSVCQLILSRLLVCYVFSSWFFCYDLSFSCFRFLFSSFAMFSLSHSWLCTSVKSPVLSPSVALHH